MAVVAVAAVVASGLNGPVQMTPGREGALYVTKRPARSRASTCLPVPKTEAASGLALPEGVARTPWSSFIVAGAAAG